MGGRRGGKDFSGGGKSDRMVTGVERRDEGYIKRREKQQDKPNQLKPVNSSYYQISQSHLFDFTAPTLQNSPINFSSLWLPRAYLPLSLQ
jgi:hypothetical protein